MKYDEALQEWGKIHLRQSYRNCDLSAESVVVRMEFEEGYFCCNGTNPLCYCSFAESPSANVRIEGSCTSYKNYKTHKAHVLSTCIPAEDFDFVAVLKEICEAGKGHVSL